MSKKDSSWSISDFYKKAWALTKENKKLWILGFALMIFSSSNSINGRSSRSYGEDSSNNSNYEQTQSIDKKLDVDTSSTSETFEIENNISDPRTDLLLGYAKEAWDQFPKLSLIPVFIFEMIVLFVFGITYSFIAAAWAHSALIEGVRQAANKKLKSLSLVSQASFKFIKPFAYLAIVPGLLFIAAFVGFMVVVAMLFSIAGVASGLLMVLLSIVLSIGGIYLILRFIVALVWAVRFVTHKNKKGKQAFKAGWKLSKDTYWKGLRLGSTNLLVLTIISLIMLIPAGVLGVGAAFSIQADGFSIMKLIPTLLAFAISMPIIQIAAAVMSVFKVATWEYAFENVLTHSKEAK